MFVAREPHGFNQKQRQFLQDRFFEVQRLGNLQQWLIGTYHGVSRDQLQVYLDEFVFRHNRRRQPMAAFQTLLGLGTGRKPTAYQQIRGGTDLPGPSTKTRSQHIELC